MNKTTAVYIRVSKGEQRHDSQVKELKDYCRARRWENLTFYMEKECGACVTRPELDRMMTDIRAGKVERIACYKLDRLGRSLTHLALIMDEMNRLRVPLICASQGIDTSDDNPAGRLQLGVLMAVAEFERSLIRERVNSGLRAARERGVRLGRPATLNKRSGEVLALKKQGLGLRTIARELGMAPSSVHSVLKAGT